MNDYEQKKQDRIDRLHARADKVRAQSDALWKESGVMASAIPAGQPIHGGTDQRYRDRMMGKTEKSFAAMDKAEYYERRAQAAEENTAISSDDPEAIAKLTEKLAGLQESQKYMKTVNAYYKATGTCRGCPGLSDEEAAKLEDSMKYHPWDKKPFASASLSNNNENINTTKKRIQKLTEAKEQGYTGWTFEGGRVEANGDKNRLQIFFDEIPSEEVRKELKSWGFLWARSEGAWQRQLTDNAIYSASRIKAIQPTDGTDPVKIQPKRKKQSGPTR